MSPRTKHRSEHRAQHQTGHQTGHQTEHRWNGPGAPTRLIAAVTLLAVLVALPAAVIATVGMPRWSTISAAIGTGRIDDAAIVHIGTTLFLALWGWFAVTALAEAGRIVARRGTGTARPVPPAGGSPTAVVRRLVRTALISTTVAMASVSPLLRHHRPALAEGRPATASSFVADAASPGASRPRECVVSSGRDTPYSLAARFGDPALRDAIIELNRGRTTPGGHPWAGGVFPARMTVALPPGISVPRATVWTAYTVADGDSIYRIAGRIAARLAAAAGTSSDGTRIRDLADEILARNLGTTMNDGTIFDDASLIHPGWQLAVPDTGGEHTARSQAPQFDHEVVAGDSYWSIAEEHLRLPTPHDVAVFTEVLIEGNAPLLGHDVDALIVPGDIVSWAPPSPAAPSPPLPAVAPAPAPAPAAPAPAGDPLRPVVIVASAPPTTSGGDPSRDAGQITPRSTERVPEPEAAAAAAAPGTPSVRRDLAGAVLLCAGAIGLIESRRRRLLRGANPRTRLTAPADAAVATERTLRSLGAVQRAVRLDLALRSAGHLLGRLGGHVLAVAVQPDGTVTLVLDRPGRPAAGPWTATADDSGWRLPGATSDDDLAGDARLAGQPCPALVQLGTVCASPSEPSLVGAELFVDLEAFGLMCIDGPADDAADILRGIVASLQLSPIGQSVNLVGHELPGATPDPATTNLDPTNLDPATGGEPAIVGATPIDHAASLDEALDRVAVLLGSTPTAIGGRRTFELRSRGTGGERWEPAVLVSGHAPHHPEMLSELVAATRDGGRGLAAVLVGPVPGASLTLRAPRTPHDRTDRVTDPIADPITDPVTDPITGEARDQPREAGWRLDRLGLAIVPIGLTSDHRAAVTASIATAGDVITVVTAHDLIAEAPVAPADDVPTRDVPTRDFPAGDTAAGELRDLPDRQPGFVAHHGRTDEPADALSRDRAGEPPGAAVATGAAVTAGAPDPQIVVHVLGPVHVTTADGTEIAFERGKSVELVAWLSQHRERATRAAARTALWEIDVRDATFANVVSDARRAMARAISPPADTEWVARTLTDELPLHPLVTSDAELLEIALRLSRGRTAADTIAMLRPALARVAGLPFANTGYLWPDAEGIGSSLTMLVTSAATECALSALQLDDVDTVFWATGQGLRALAGHEELIGVRMRAHAQRGDLAGVRHEFEAYQRALQADPWSDEEPAAKLVDLRSQLLDQRVRTIA